MYQSAHSNLPQMCVEFGKAYLQWNLQQYDCSGQEPTPAHLHVHQVGEDHQVERSDPEVVQKQERLREGQEEGGRRKGEDRKGAGEEMISEERKYDVDIKVYRVFFLTKSNLCTSLDARLTTCPMEIWPMVT